MTIEADFNTKLPSAEPTDSDDVRWALETATAMWTNGDFHEALRWLRRAAESASEEGADMRAVELAKLGAELRGHLAIPTSIPPAAPEPADEDRFDHAAETLLKPASTPPPAWPHVPADEPARESSDGEVSSSGSRSFLHTQLGIGPGGESDGVAEPATDPSAAPGPHETTSVRSEADASLSRASQAPTTTGATSATPTDLEEPAREPSGFVSHQAIRVAITTSPERRGVLIAKVLETGERVPPGAKEALFVALEPGIELYV